MDELPHHFFHPGSGESEVNELCLNNRYSESTRVLQLCDFVSVITYDCSDLGIYCVLILK